MGKILLVVVLFAALVYGFFWLLERRNQLGVPRARRPAPRPTRPSAPDDDESFLRELDRRGRAARDRQARDRRAREDERRQRDGDGREDPEQP